MEGHEVFLDELRKLEENEERHYSSLSKRLARLEVKSTILPQDDEGRMMMGIILVVVAVTMLPMLIDLVKQWAKPSL